MGCGAVLATALYDVTCRPNADGRIATVQLRWEDPDVVEFASLVSRASQIWALGN